MSAEQNKAILMSGAEAFNHRADRSGWFEIHDPAVRAYGLAPEPLNLEGLRRFYSGLWNAFPDLEISVDSLVAEEERVAWRLSVRGTHEAEFRGIPATGTEVTFGAQYMFAFHDGKIVTRWTNFYRLGVLVQLGAVAAPA